MTDEGVASGVWRVVAVWNDERKGRWESVELQDGDGDVRGDVEWRR